MKTIKFLRETEIQRVEKSTKLPNWPEKGSVPSKLEVTKFSIDARAKKVTRISDRANQHWMG